MIVCKFGGTSVADIMGARNVKRIMNENSNRKIAVVSALGKSKEHIKITDKLYECFVIYQNDILRAMGVMNEVVDRYSNLAEELGVKHIFNRERKQILSHMQDGASKEYIVSRGEALCAKLYAKYLGAIYLDAKGYIIFKKEGIIDENLTKKRLLTLDLSKKYVIGGFYGANERGDIVLFSRGGSDITGALIAKLLNFELYENYTDVDGVFNKDPNIFNGARPLAILNYKTAYQMADAGNEVVHKDALKLLQCTSIVLIVKNTFNLSNFGTIVLNTNYSFGYTFISIAHQFLITTSKPTKIDLNKLKQLAEVKRVFFDGRRYYILMSNIYSKEEVLKWRLDDGDFCNVCKISIFSNIKINKNHIKNIKKVQKVLKKYIIWANFLNFDNNFVVLCTEQNSPKILSILNKYLQV